MDIEGTESGPHTILNVKSELKVEQLVERALEKGCRVASVRDYYLENIPENTSRIILYFSKIPANKIESAVKLLRDAWFG